jgi:hypothetical protein
MYCLVENLSDVWEIRREDVTLEQELKNGFFGTVYKGNWQKYKDREPVIVAVKVIQLYTINVN